MYTVKTIALTVTSTHIHRLCITDMRYSEYTYIQSVYFETLNKTLMLYIVRTVSSVLSQ